MNYYNENNPRTAAWLRELINHGCVPRGVVDERSIEDVRPSELAGYAQCHFFAGIGGWALALRLAGWPDDKPVWTGSCPCQPFSTAGEGKGVADERHLWPAFKWQIEQRKPAIVFGEQVASKAGREWFGGVRDDLEALAYQVGCADLCAPSVRAVHQRARLWWFANAAGIHGESWGVLEKGAERGAPFSARRIPRVEVAGGRWRCAAWPGSLPTLVRSSNGLSAALHGFGNAVIPQLGAEFILAAMEAIETEGAGE